MEKLTDLIKPANVGPKAVYEQERNFDAGYSPSSTPHKFIRKEKIAGKWYRVYQGWIKVGIKAIKWCVLLCVVVVVYVYFIGV